MTSDNCYCDCYKIDDSYNKNPNFIIACGNNPLEKDPGIVNCSSCYDFESETDNSKSSNDISLESNEGKSDDNFCQDILFVDGNQADLDEYENESLLMERIWFLSKPPLMEKPVFTVPARRIQVIRERLSSIVKCVSSIKQHLRPQIEKNMNKRRFKKKNSEYVPVRRISFENENEDPEIILPPCAQKLSDFM